MRLAIDADHYWSSKPQPLREEGERLADCHHIPKFSPPGFSLLLPCLHDINKKCLAHGVNTPSADCSVKEQLDETIRWWGADVQWCSLQLQECVKDNRQTTTTLRSEYWCAAYQGSVFCFDKKTNLGNGNFCQSREPNRFSESGVFCAMRGIRLAVTHVFVMCGLVQALQSSTCRMG